MGNVLNGLEPRDVFHWFAEISRIPRGSRNERRIAEYVVSFAKQRGLHSYMDDLYNVIITKPGSKGCEELPPVLLECHTDMVCVSAPGVQHDFSNDPIGFVREGDVLRAKGTSLGADNGVSVAMLLALLDRADIQHPPLECLFATQEELGLLGVKHLDMGKIHARRAIGLDAGFEGVFCKGTSTKYSYELRLDVHREAFEGQAYRLLIDGLRGGMEGVMMAKERVSAAQVSARALLHLQRTFALRLEDICVHSRGIPERCEAFFRARPEDGAALCEAVAALEGGLRKELQKSEPGLCLRIAPQEPRGVPLSAQDSAGVIAFLNAFPWRGRGRDVENLTQITSFVTMRDMGMDEGSLHLKATVSAETRSAAEAIDDLFWLFGRLFGVRVVEKGVEPGWEPLDVSPMRDTMVSAYEELFGRKPYVKVSHGDNDCSELYRRIPGMDIITTAATYYDFHTPNEYLELPSVGKVYRLVQRTLEKLCD